MSGLDAFGAAVGVLQVLDTCLHTLSSLYAFCSRMHDAPSAIAHHKSEIHELVEILECIRDTPPLQTAQVASNISGISHHAKVLLDRLDKVTATKTEPKMSRGWKALKFAYVKEDIDVSFVALDRKKTALGLCIANIDSLMLQDVGANVATLIARFDKSREDQSIALVSTVSMSVPFNNLPAYCASGFIGREGLLQLMTTAMNSQGNKIAMIVLVGMGGTGKTQLALKYGERLSAGRTSVFWIHAASEESVRRAYSAIAEDLAIQRQDSVKLQSLDAKVRYTTRAIRDLSEPWLLIFDNYDDPSTFSNLPSFIPTPSCSYNGMVIVTSRHPDAARLGGCKIDVGPMIEDESIALLLTRANVSVTAANRDIAIPIVRRLGHLALAVDQAGSYLHKRRISLQDFEDHFETQREHILNYTPSLWNYTRVLGVADSASRLSVFTTWEMSIKYLQRTAHPYELDFTTLLGFFQCSNISESLFRVHYDCCSRARSLGYGKVSTATTSQTLTAQELEFSTPTWTKAFTDETGSWDSLSFRNCLSTLHDLFLIQNFSGRLDKPCKLAIHPLVSDWIKLRITDTARQQFVTEAARICSNFITSTAFSEFSPKEQQYILNHLDETLKNESLFAERHEGEDLRLWNSLLNSFAEFYNSSGRYAQAGALYERVLAQPPGVEPTMQAGTMHALAVVYHSQGRHAEAKHLFKKALKSRQTLLGATHLKTLATIECLANIHRSAARYEKAEGLYLVVLKGREAQLGSDHPDTLQAVASVANNYRLQGRYEEAELVYLRAHSGCTEKLGSDNLITITVINDLANNLQAQKKLTEAEDLYLRAFEGRKAQLGRNHPDTLWTMADLANNYQSQERYVEAEELYRQAVLGNDSNLGPDHPETLWSIDGLANVIRQQKRYDEAKVLYNRVLTGREKCLGPDHHNTLRTLKGLGRAYEEQHRFDEAESLYNRALVGFQRQLGPDHPETLDTILILNRNSSSQRAYLETNRLVARRANFSYLLRKCFFGLNCSGSKQEQVYPLKSRVSSNPPDPTRGTRLGGLTERGRRAG